MNQTELVQKSYDIARQRYADVGVDTEQALKKLQQLAISIQCWQADDVVGFENIENLGGGGIQATGSYPGRARNIDELRQDIEEVLTMIGGDAHRFSLHAIYGEFGDKKIDRNQVAPEHFAGWMQWAKEHNLKLDFNSTSFGHAKSGDLTLANPDKGIRDFWIEHTKCCRLISEEMGKFQADPCIMNIWIHDGMKDLTVNRYKYRQLLEQSLDDIFATDYKNMKDCIESKLFGIALESFTAGSHDFYLGYGAKRQKMVTVDTGHFHISENIADKISSMLLFVPELMLHVSRPIRWDSDHVVILNDEVSELAKEILRADALDKIHVGLDFFDASINRIGAYVIGIRSTQKAFLQALLEPLALLRKHEEKGQYFERLALLEEAKGLPWSAVWDYFCLKNGIAVGEDYIAQVQQYEKNVTSKRK